MLTYSLFAQSEDLANQSHQAKELMAHGRFEDAIPIYRHLLAAVPGNPGLMLNLGLAEEMAGHPGQAAPQFDAVLKLQPENIPALTSLSMAQLQLNQPRAALAPLEKLLRLQPENRNARGMLASAYLSLNRPAESAEQYRKLASADASDPKAWYGLGKAYEMLAAQSFSRLSKESPESPYVAALLADSRLQRKQFRSAFYFYRQAQSKLPDLPGIHSGLSKVYQDTGHADWAAQEKRMEHTASEVNCQTQNAECNFLKGDLLAATKTSAGAENLFWTTKAYNQLAIEAFDRLGKLPDSVEIHALKAEILHGHGQDAEAAAEWRTSLTLSPGNPQLEAELANSLFVAHKYDEAIPLLEKLLAKQSGAPDLNFMLGESLWRTQQPEKAVPYLTKALQLDPNLLPAHAALGMVDTLLDKNAQAVSHLEKAISLDDDGSLHYSLARAYQAVGDTEQAKTTMQQYQKIKQKNQQINDELAKEAEIVAPTAR